MDPQVEFAGLQLSEERIVVGDDAIADPVELWASTKVIGIRLHVDRLTAIKGRVPERTDPYRQ